MLEKLRDALTTENESMVAAALISELPALLGNDWLSQLKASPLMPDPTKTNTDLKDFVADTLALLSGLLNVHNVAINAADVEELALVLLTLGDWFRAVNDRLKNSRLFSLTPGHQLQLICAAFEDQSRLLHIKANEMVRELHDRDGEIDLRSVRLLSLKSTTDTTSLLFNSFEAKGESLELCLKYLFWIHKGGFSEPEYHIDPYRDPLLVGEVLALADIHTILMTLWTTYRYKNWRAQLKENVLVFEPPSRAQYILEDVSIDRQHQYFTELGMGGLFSGDVNPRRCDRRIDKLSSRASRRRCEWLRSLPAKDLRTALEELTVSDVVAIEALNKQYKEKPADVLVDPKGHRVAMSDFLLALKYLRVLAEVHQQTVWKRFNVQSDQYEQLCPIFSFEDLAAKLAETGLLDLHTARGSLRLLMFNPRSRNLEIWQQPLIPWDDHRCLFLPSIAAHCNTLKFVESHLAESGYPFDDRGPALEAEIRKELRASGKQHGVRVVPHQLKFVASDGQQVEIDIMATFRDHLIIAEVKCVKTPTEIAQTHKPWPRIKEGVDQLKRVRSVLTADWQTVKEHSQLPLPPEPPDDDHLIMVVLTNIFTFTGQTVEGIPICDETAFLRYFEDDDAITATKIYRGMKSGETRILRRLWTNGVPTPSDLKRYLLMPPQVEMALEGYGFEYQPVPAVNSRLQPLAYLIVAPNVE